MGSICKFISLTAAAIICVLLAAPLPAHANAIATARNDLGVGCSSTEATSASCAGVPNAASSASLATGVLAVQASCCDYAHSSNGLSSATATYSDTMTLILPNGYTAATIPFVTFDLNVSGAKIGISGPSLSAQHPAAAINDLLQIGNAGALISGSASGCQSTDPNPDFCGSASPNTPLDLSVTLTNIPRTDLTFNFTAQLQASATGFDPGPDKFPKGSSFADAMDPGQLAIDLPQGFSFTSGSEVLLSQAATVPEPSSLIILSTALAGIGLIRRRARRRRPT